MIGARQGTMTVLQRVVAAAMSQDMRGFVVPGMDMARAAGLDLESAGVRLCATPRHANVLIVIGPLPAGLMDAATAAYAQMPRPRAILALGSGNLAPLPLADANGPLTQAGLVTAMGALRRVIATGSFRPDVDDFEAAALQTRTEYTCPMHPEVVQAAPGNCPKCGMTLVPRETAASPHAGHTMPGESPQMAARAEVKPMAGHHDHSTSDHGAHGHGQHHGHGHASETPAQYTCPMHPEVLSDDPGSCPKCGMHLVPVDATDGHDVHDHGAHGHGQHHGHGHAKKDDHDGGHGGHGGHGAHGNGEPVDGIEAHFMSMVDLTRDMPASTDGLKMEWIEVPFGPFFPGLPGGLQVDLTLDGDAVAAVRASSAVGPGEILPQGATSPDAFVDHLAALSPLSPVAYRLLACLALEQAAGQSVAPDIARARIAAAERERMASHLGWLAGFGAQSGFGWLEKRAAAVHRKLHGATPAKITTLGPEITALLARIRRTPLLSARLNGIGHLPDKDALVGPAARAAGVARDARRDDPRYADLGFAVLTMAQGDALARLALRCGEISQSLELISGAGAIAMPEPQGIDAATGKGEAVVETPRGAARLSLTLHNGKVTAAEIETPAKAQIALISTLAEGRELGDALTAIGSLDISPWEVTA